MERKGSAHVRGGQLFATLCLVACQASLSGEFFRQEYWSRLPFPTPGYLPGSGIPPTSPESPASAGRFFTHEPPRNPGRAQRALQMGGGGGAEIVCREPCPQSPQKGFCGERLRPDLGHLLCLPQAVPQELPCLSACGVGQCAGPGSSQSQES